MSCKRMLVQFLVILALPLTMGGCGLPDLTDLTSAAEDMMETATDLMKLIEDKVESGELKNEVQDVAGASIDKLVNGISDTMEQNGGVMVDRLNGTLDDVFANTEDLLDKMANAVLAGSEELILSMSEQLQLNTSLIGAQLEDLVSLGIGGSIVIVDRATNLIAILVAVVGLLVFGILFLRMRKKPKGMQFVGLGIAAVFLVVLLVPQARGLIFSGLDVGQTLESVQPPPKITGIAPETFTLGATPKLTIYGNHLNKLEGLSVRLVQAGNQMFTFPKNTIVTASKTKIVLGNFGNIGWTPPRYSRFGPMVLGQNAQPAVVAAYAKFANANQTRLSPVVRPTMTPAQPRAALDPAKRRAWRTRLGTPIKIEAARAKVDATAAATLKPEVWQNMQAKITDFYRGQYKLDSGEYGLEVFAGDARVESAQPITVLNPPPPAPLPDIRVTSLQWNGGIPAQNEMRSLRVGLAFLHPQEIERPFRLQITTSPGDMAPFDVDVPLGQVQASLGSGNQIEIDTRRIKLPTARTYAFRVVADSAGRVDESNEGNNKFDTTLAVGAHVYLLQVSIAQFKSKFQGAAEVQLTGSVGAQTLKASWKKAVKKNQTYDLGVNMPFGAVTPGEVFSLSAVVRMNIGFFPFQAVGHQNIHIGESPTGGKDSKDVPLHVEGNFDVFGTAKFTRALAVK